MHRLTQFSPYLPNGARLTCLRSMFSEWHSCLGLFLNICHSANVLIKAWYKTRPLLRRPRESAMPDHGTETPNDHPWNVRQAARFLGVSPQTVYLWVERKQIPHLRVMGRNIRFLRSDLERFRASFRQEPERL